MSLLTPKYCLAQLGDPDNERDMRLWTVPDELIVIPALPRRIYCNKRLIAPLSQALRAVINAKLVDEIKTWDGCFNVRTQRGSKNMSLHAWGVAIDINAAWNRLGQIPKLSPQLVKCFTTNGFYWGGNFERIDGMHFQLTREAFDAQHE